MFPYQTFEPPEVVNSCSSPRDPPVTSLEDDPLAGLPDSCEVLMFTNFNALRKAVSFVVDKLNHNDDDGNQFIVIHRLTKHARQRLDEEKDILGSTFRLMWEGETGIIKLMPSAAHDYATDDLSRTISRACEGMGVPLLEIAWGTSTTHPGQSGDKGKQADQCLSPLPRQPVNGQVTGWPTLVIETGVSESLPRLRQDAAWWFRNSRGDTRIVLVMSLKKKTQEIFLEKWQLAPANTLNLTRGVINQLRQQVPPPMPPLIQQNPASQQPFVLQEIRITKTSAFGGPLVLPFQAFFCRPPQGAEGDIVLGPQQLTFCARFI